MMETIIALSALVIIGVALLCKLSRIHDTQKEILNELQMQNIRMKRSEQH